MNEFIEGQDEVDEVCADSMQIGAVETCEADELQDDSSESTERDTELSEKDLEIAQLEQQYDQAKLSIDMSRTEDEKDYWIKRSDEIWDAKDKASAEYWQLKGLK